MNDVTKLSVIPFDEIQKAQATLERNGVFRTPLVPLNVDVPNKRIYLKLECLQPVRSFKIRGACNVLCGIDPEEAKHGVYTCSAGNFAQGLAWMAQKRGLPCDVIVPDTAPQLKFDAIARFEANIHKVPHAAWWRIMETGHYEGMKGTFLHPVCMRDVIAGNGTMGIEILEDLPTVDTVVCPWGGGGNLAGIGSAFRQLKPSVQMVACEVETGAPLTASRQAGKAVSLARHRASFVDGMNPKSMFPEMWNLASNLVSDTVVLSSEAIGDAVQMIVERNGVVAEGAGAATVAAALTDQVPDGDIVCVISGGNIAPNILVDILRGERPV